ncbi:MAG TPA: hypothetical protein VFR15_02955 [Chloroflexia bacterium]|nr:hypothetical protein [Chloroflexia bacterium]
MTASNEKSAPDDGRNDFDFLIGTWRTHNRRLRERLKGSTEWEEFPGRFVVRKLLGGLGNLDEVVLERPEGRTEAVTLRLFNPESRQWSIYWADSVTAVLQPPMIGEFKDGRGRFYDQEMFEGRAIYCRFIWSEITATSCRWEQAYSADGGKTWETNWVMEFTREGDV